MLLTGILIRLNGAGAGAGARAGAGAGAGATGLLFFLSEAGSAGA